MLDDSVYNIYISQNLQGQRGREEELKFRRLKIISSFVTAPTPKIESMRAELVQTPHKKSPPFVEEKE